MKPYYEERNGPGLYIAVAFIAAFLLFQCVCVVAACRGELAIYRGSQRIFP